MDLIICSICKEEKPLDDYYDHPAGKHGKLNRCKPCHRAASRKNRANRIDYYRDYDKHRAMQPHRIATRLRYQDTEEGKEATERAKKKWLLANPLKRAAQVSVGNAVRDGKLEKLKSCEECGVSNVRIHGHHDDYAKPLNVRWLCSQCHSDWHKENGEGLNAVDETA